MNVQGEQQMYFSDQDQSPSNSLMVGNTSLSIINSFIEAWKNLCYVETIKYLF